MRQGSVKVGVALLVAVIAAVGVLAGSALARKTVRVSDTVTVGLVDKPKLYGGTVAGFNPARFAGLCAPGRKVNLNFRDAPNQSVELIGTDRTDGSGNWAVEAQKTLHGQIQAVAKKRIFHRNGKRILCRSAHTAFQNT